MDYQIAIEKIKKIVLTTPEHKILQKTVEFLNNNFEKYNWVGIYVVKDKNLILGPWKGPHATEHTNIPIGKGICGSAAKSGRTELIDDVSKDKRYLSCFISTRSEIVVPIKRNNKTIGEIDIDSDIPSAFNKYDSEFLEKVADIISKYICN